MPRPRKSKGEDIVSKEKEIKEITIQSLGGVYRSNGVGYGNQGSLTCRFDFETFKKNIRNQFARSGPTAPSLLMVNGGVLLRSSVTDEELQIVFRSLGL